MQEEVAVSRNLAGYAVIGPAQEPVEGVTVELCTSGWSKVVSSVKTDSRGYFMLEAPKVGRIFYLRFSAPGFHIYQLRVRLKTKAKSVLRISLQVAT